MKGLRSSEFSKSQDKSSFFIWILFRQNASWQGEIQWMEGNKARKFRSLLEMICLILEAVESSGPEALYELRMWEGESESDNSVCKEFSPTREPFSGLE